MKFDSGISFFELRGRPLTHLRWKVQAVFVCGDQAACPYHCETHEDVEQAQTKDLPSHQMLHTPEEVR